MSQRSIPAKEVDWSSVSHAFGSAIEIPALLRSIRSDSQEVRQRAYSDLVDLLVHQGSRFEASAAVAPHLIDIVADPAAPDRFAACQVLAAIAVGDESSWLSDRSDPSDMRAEVQRRAPLSREELEAEHRDWIAAAPNEEERSARARGAEWGDVEGARDEQRWTIEAYDAVRAGVPVYVAALEASEAAVRLYAAYLLAWFPEDEGLVGPALAGLIRREPEPVVAATACVAAGLSCPNGSEVLVDALSGRRGSVNRAERWSAVLGLSRILRHPDRSLVSELYACLFGAIGPVPYWPFFEGEMAGMAALTIADLTPEVAGDRIDVLAERAATADPTADAFALLTALLDAAFPIGPIPDGVGFADLTPTQQRALSTLLSSNVLQAAPRMLTRYNLPDSEQQLRAWCGG
ncbi:hypothetical protein [Micromonospora cremea]|uniref:HEAT repeat-containing protein n=1 Tax=Micromonospora cremea TaxID=709881 RepID=A0A1N6ARQ0_9ACTN|nr:hypothetical protein [Micromonospora cremea]SIN36710.1 hypothetical protein SAMN04489832_6024 [Micromonospora cremea]